LRFPARRGKVGVMQNVSDESSRREEALFRPYLLNRLTDFEPHIKKETGAQLVTAKQVRKDIYDNLSMLFNSRSHPSGEELGNDPELERSVLGYGISDFCGKMHSDNTRAYLRDHILKQLRYFEPRFANDSLEVSFKDDGPTDSKSVLEFSITASVNVKEVGEELRFFTKLDTETGIAEIYCG